MAPVVIKEPVEVPSPIPADLLVDCYIPTYREGQPRTAFYSFTGELVKALEDCNRVKASHRDKSTQSSGPSAGHPRAVDVPSVPPVDGGSDT
jgi:hypothetical protein